MAIIGLGLSYGFAHGLHGVALTPPVLTAMLLLLGLGVAAQHFPIPIQPHHKVDTSMAAYFAGLLLFGAAAVVPLVGVSQLVGQSTLALRKSASTRRPLRSPRSIIFNTSQLIAAVAFGSVIFPAGLDEATALEPGILWRIPVAAIVIHCVNTIAVATMIGLQRRENPFVVWWASQRADLIEVSGLFLIGLATALMTVYVAWAPLVMGLPAVVLYGSLKRSIDLLDREREARQRAEAATAKARQLQLEIERNWTPLVAVLDGLSDGVIVFNTERRATYINPRAAQILRFDLAATLDRPADAIISAVAANLRDPSAARLVWQDLLSHPSDYPQGEIELSGSPPRLLQLNIFPVSDESGVRIGLVIRDATDARVRAVLEDRARIAMDLHDGTIQSLYGVVLTLKARERSNGNGNSRSRLILETSLQDEISTINNVIQEIRNYVFDLRQTNSRYQSVLSGLTALVRELETVSPIEFVLEVDSQVDEFLGHDVVPTVIHIVREATTNVIRHANARRIAIAAKQTGDSMVLTVVDDGRGFASIDLESQTGNGLRNMAERARALGGDFFLETAPGRGATIRVSLPITEMGE